MGTLTGVFLLLLAAQTQPATATPTPTPDPWLAIRFMAGEWEGESEGTPGKGNVKRSYTFVLNDKFLNEQNVSTYPPQPRNPKGEVHHHWSFFSYDLTRRALVLRQFHQEGFVNQFAMTPPAAAPNVIVFESEALENTPKGWKARETYEIVSDSEFVETFEIASTGPYEVYSRTRFKRDKFGPLPRLFEALEAKPGARIADVGAGDGFYSLQLAGVVAPGGRITATDIDSAGLARLRTKIESGKVVNVDVVLGKADDPLLEPGAFDAVLIRNAYHEMAEHQTILRHIHAALKPGGRLVVAEPIRENHRKMSRSEQVALHHIASEFVVSDLLAAGFEIRRRDESFDPFTDMKNPGGYWLIVAIPTGK